MDEGGERRVRARTPRLALGTVGEDLRGLADRYLEEYLDKIELATDELDDEQVWARTGPGTNSIGNLLLHLCGNLSLWVLASLGGEDYTRDRPAEFAADRTHTKSLLLGELRRVVERARQVIAGLDSQALDRTYEIQGYATDGRGIVFHVVEHMSYHTGQIVLLAKSMLTDRGAFEFYPHLRSESGG
jgi:uncharacterized damage-inducible protein DinB